MPTALTPAVWEIEEQANGVAIIVTLHPPLWKFWSPRGRVRMELEKMEALVFYQTFHRVLTRAMILE